MTYKRFYKLFNRLPLHDDEMKERLVQQYTNGRTSSLRAMSTAEYDALCDALERSTADPQHELRKKKRSAALRLMQQLGIDTTDWPRINAFCRDRRIAGFKIAVRQQIFFCFGRRESFKFDIFDGNFAGGPESPAGTADRTGRAVPAADNLHAARRPS